MNDRDDRIEQERQRRRLAEERSRALERELLAAERRAATAERRLGRVLQVPPVRIAMGLRRTLLGGRDRLTRAFARATRAPGALRFRARRWWQQRGLRASPAAEAAFRARVLAVTPASDRVDGPLVSIVVLNRNGESLLRQLVPALERTTYSPLELVVVDNGSVDGSRRYLEASGSPIPIRILRNADNAPFGAANDQGVAAASGELVLLLNNDVEPIHPGWLGHLVSTVLDDGATAAGARLVYPRRTRPRAGERHPDLSLQHRGVQFVLERGLAVPRVLGAGEDPFGPAATAVEEVPALTAACVLMRRDTYEAVGGFSPGYDYGWEDMDLCLRLRSTGGRLVFDGRAVLLHHESATRVRTDAPAARARLEANRARFQATWGPRLYREVLLDVIDGTGQWSRSPLRVDVVGGSASAGSLALDLVAGMEAMGWDARWVRQLPVDRSARVRADRGPADLILSLEPGVDLRRIPDAPVTLAWLDGPAEAWIGTPWFDHYDVVLVADQAAQGLVAAESAKVPVAVLASAAASGQGSAVRDALRDWALARRVAVRTGPPNHDVAAHWGDTWFGHSLQRALERAGHPTRVEILPEWTAPGDLRSDVTIHVLGQSEAPTRPGQVNILWQISHPDLARPELYERYDSVFVASDSFAERMRPLVRVPVAPLHQATDPARFHPAEGGPAHELLFVANSRNVRRRLLDDLLPTTHELAVYGTGWRPDLLDPHYLAGATIPNHELHRYYAAASIVLSDHWTDMRDEGFIANRLYDVLASGGFVISDEVEGIEAEFEGAVVTYRTASELRELIERWLADGPGRRERAERGRRAVLERHTFDHRVTAILAVVGPLLESRPSSVLLG